ncbi:hypothetical protein, partial [Cronobacter sakazakii]|uniref:hypothetical protein n=1 Tax=Cronobacter sakazakii TaxID=28141 RepID=UPI001CEC6FE8
RAPAASLADTLFFIVGVIAYTNPPIMVLFCWLASRQPSNDVYTDYFAAGPRRLCLPAVILPSFHRDFITLTPRCLVTSASVRS